MTKPDNSLSHLPLFVAIESQPESIRQGPRMFSRSMAQQLLAHLSADLSSILPDVQQTAITASAALYDQSQLLRAGLPIFSTLSELLEASFSGQDFQPRLLAFGAHKGQLPNISLMPDSNLAGGPFQLIPLQLSADAEKISALAEQLEHQLLENGQLSAHSAQWLQEELGQKIVHARFMTLNDLLAMLYMQLETIGLEPLWQWLEKMLQNPDFDDRIGLANGPELEYHDGKALIHFLTFDQWAAGMSEDDSLTEPSQSYLSWLNKYRQATLLLEAHGISLDIHGIHSPDEQQSGSLYCERSSIMSTAEGITHHIDPQLGLIASSASLNGQQFNYYPLQSAGLEELRALLSARYPGLAIADQYNGLCLNQSGSKLTLKHG